MDLAESLRQTSSPEAEECPYEMESFPARPLLKSVTVPETVKRRVPTKHYVYKVVVRWTDEKEIIIYRKYSFFFDFVVKLNELLATLPPEDVKLTMQLPELPGRVLFGRSEVHQVAEKRRRKIEEFCQKLIALPPEISQSSLVLGFFNTWPDDTMLRRPSAPNIHVITSPVISASSSAKSPSPPHLPPLVISNGASDSTQSKPERPPAPSPPPPDVTSPLSPRSPAVDKLALEAIISHPDEMESLEQYRVLANYDRKDAHQVSLVASQMVHVIEKHDTGWWMVMSEDEQGYAPASYLEPVEETTDLDIHPENLTNQVYEAMETYFAENDDEVTMKAGDHVEVISKSMDGWWKIRCNGAVGYSPAALIRRKNSIVEEHIYESEKSIYEGLNIHRPPPRRNTIDPTAIQKVREKFQKPRSIYVDSTEGESDEDTPKCYKVANSNGIKKAGKKVGHSSVDFSEDDHIYEMEPPLYEDPEDIETGDNGSIYENTDFPSRASLTRKSSSPAVLNSLPSQKPPKVIVQARAHSSSEVQQPKLKRPPRHSLDDYEDPDAMMENTDGAENLDYVDMSAGEATHNTYIDPEDLRRTSTCSSATASSGSFTSNKRPDSTTSVPGAALSSVLSPKAKVPGQQTEPVFDDDYIVMDPLYVEPPAEETDGNADTLKAEKTPPRGSPVSIRPLPPPPYGSSPTSEKKVLSRTKSLENFLSSSLREKAGNAKIPSPEMKRKPLPIPPPRVKSPLDKQLSASNDQTPPTKPKPSPPNRAKPTNINGLVEQLSSQLKTSSQPLPTTSPQNTRKEKKLHPLAHTVSTPNMEAVLPKTYVSVSSYTSQTEECLSFSAGDKCVLIQQSKDGWWLVNIGGREGWTPGEYWKEDVKRECNLPKPPSFAPKKLQDTRKPRSVTEGADSLSNSLDLGSIDHKPEVVQEEEQSKPFAHSVNLGKSSVGSVQEASPVKSKVPAPPRPLQPAQKVKPLKPPKPSLPTKPERVKKTPSRDSVSPSSPPSSRKKPSSHSPSPPPLPPANLTKKMSGSEQRSQSASQSVQEMNGHASEPTIHDYGHLNEVNTAVIETAPWFAGKMERPQAEQFLMECGRQREFLIRERTTKDGYYALSVRYHYSCKHFNIDPSPDGQFTMGTLSFPTIDHIISHYQQNSLFIHEGQHITLSQPVKKKSPRPSEAHRHTPNLH